ncbi:MAG: DeoR/GlpR transcriptional regulator [Castellaniella sp.]|uniref:DeoR/GlpR family DNA-binding transcription regulator n=1 Tax=Castellaniella sp. TaxID=1955812 RepID=UPI0011F4F067|nr:DeoR/GlpR family DNA-binding transcription regulator [Castellaniella sp.]TAN30032.1 MAG: DeoR/GlpR transcriptional regulator [Castellaniella sp.]
MNHTLQSNEVWQGADTRTSSLPRQRVIVQLARKHGFVMIDALARDLGVTTQTIRRDINHLCRCGILSRFHGGAVFGSSIENPPYEARVGALSAEKEAIAATVAKEVPDGTSVFLDIGTTVEAVARRLTKNRNMKVVTNNLNVVEIFRHCDSIETIVASGTVRKADGAILGTSTATFIRHFSLDFSILGVVAISKTGDILDFSMDEEPTTQAILGSSEKAFIVADHSKFGRTAMFKVGHASQAHGVVTDALPERGDWAHDLDARKVRVVIAKSIRLTSAS